MANPPNKNPMDALAHLTQTGSPPPQSPEEEEAQLLHDVKTVLDVVERIVGDNIFDMQTLVETAAEELREQIRENAEGESE